MHNIARDQAEGLRRLLGKEGLRVLKLNSARRGVGQTSCAVNLAAALAEKGRAVLILDENDDAGNVGDFLGQRLPREFLHVVRAECGLEQVVKPVAGISVLPAARGIAALARLSREDQNRLSDSIATFRLPVDVVIIDTVAGSNSRLLTLSPATQEEVLVVAGSAASVTDAYAFIKGASAEYGKRRYRVLLSKVRNEPQARALFNNMAGAARRYLGVELDFMGIIPPDEKIKRAAQMGLPVLRAFPDAPSAAVFRQLGLTVAEWPRSADGGGDMAAFLHGLVRCGGAAASSRAMEHSSAWRAPRSLGATAGRHRELEAVS